MAVYSTKLLSMLLNLFLDKKAITSVVKAKYSTITALLHI